MISAFKAKIENRFLKDNSERSSTIIKNILFSLTIKFGSILIGLMLVPMTINYISPLQYGIWLTISSIVSWMNFFDIGMGNGLRNKLTHAIALNQYEEARKYISTTYAVLICFSSIIFLLFFFINPYIDWRSFLNVPSSVPDNLQTVILIVLCSFCLQFVVQTLNTVLTAIHKPAKASLISFLGQLGLLIAIYSLTKTIPGSLTILVLALTTIPIGVLILSSLVLYTGDLSSISPTYRKIDFRYAKSILNTGGVFFFIQIGTMILFQTDNIIITKVIGPQAVTQFNVAYKLFAVLTMLFTIIMTPYWSAFTDAYAKSDFVWMKRTLKRMRYMWLALSLIVVPLLCIFSKYIFKFWLGKTVEVSPFLSVSMGLYVIGYTGMMVSCYFLNGLGKLRIQLYLYLIVCVVNIPVCIFLGKTFGVPGVTLSNVIAFIFMGSVFWIQSTKIVNRTAKGIWNA